MVVWLPEHRSAIPLCGTSGEIALVGALKALCDGSPDFTRCDPIAIIDPEGNEHRLDGVGWLGPAVTDRGTGKAPETPDTHVPLE